MNVDYFSRNTLTIQGFTDNEIILLGENDIDITGQADTRAKQWIVSASYDLKFKKNRRKDSREDSY